VTGPRASDGAVTLTGSATVAGWPSTPVVLTGTLSDANVLGGSYRMGQDTAPTGLPGGVITYTISAAPQPRKQREGRGSGGAGGRFGGQRGGCTGIVEQRQQRLGFGHLRVDKGGRKGQGAPLRLEPQVAVEGFLEPE